MPESVLDQGIQVNKEPDSPLAELDPPVKEKPTKEKPQVASKVQPLEETGAKNPVSASDAFPEGEEGWQAVHRQRSAGLHGRRLLTVIKKKLLPKSEEKLKNNFQSGKFELGKVGKGRGNSVEWWGSAGIGGRGVAGGGGKNGEDERGILLKNVSHRSRNFGKIFDESSVKTGVTEETPNTFDSSGM
nr:hypothetical protein [Tanacetum cinerariifolium]